MKEILHAIIETIYSSARAGSVDMKRYVGLAAMIFLGGSNTVPPRRTFARHGADRTQDRRNASDTATKDVLALNTAMFAL